ncbi:hypothetical protein [Helicobacter felis]|nr:hypothetical protein [Helicobacter felis]
MAHTKRIPASPKEEETTPPKDTPIPPEFEGGKHGDNNSITQITPEHTLKVLESAPRAPIP